MGKLVDAARLEVQQHIHRLHVLPIVIIYLNNVCDSGCQTCAIWKNNELLKVPAERQISDDLLGKLYMSLGAWRPRQILLSGGEPLLHPRFPEVVRNVRAIVEKICVVTNGLLLNSYEVAALDGIGEFYISFDAPDAQTYKTIRGVDGFDRLLAGLELLHNVFHRPKIIARCTLQRDNVRRIPELVQAARQLGFDALSFLAADISSQAFARDLHGTPDVNRILPSGEDLQVMQSDLELIPDVEDGFVEGGSVELQRILRYFHALRGNGPFPAVRCNAPWTSVVIETTGKIRGCFFQPVIGDFRTINGDTAVRFRRALNVNDDPICQRCVCSKFIGRREFLRL